MESQSEIQFWITLMSLVIVGIETSEGCGSIDDPTYYSIYSWDSATIKTPFNTYDYPNNLDCYWIFEASDPTSTLAFAFSPDFEIEDSPGCVKDFVRIYETNTTDNSSLHGTYCGDTPPSPFWVGHHGTHQMLVWFHSDSSGQKPGFRMMVAVDNIPWHFAEPGGVPGVVIFLIVFFSFLPLLSIIISIIVCCYCMKKKKPKGGMVVNTNQVQHGEIPMQVFTSPVTAHYSPMYPGLPQPGANPSQPVQQPGSVQAVPTSPPPAYKQ